MSEKALCLRKVFTLLGILLLSMFVFHTGGTALAKVVPSQEVLDGLTFSKPEIQDYFITDEGKGRYFVRLSDAPLASYTGTIIGYDATSPRSTGDAKLNLNSDAATSYAGYLEAKRDTLITEMEETVGHSVSVIYEYYIALNAVAVWLTPEEAEMIGGLSGVTGVIRDHDHKIQTNTSVVLIDAPGVWTTTVTNDLISKGEDTVIGIIDTGINPTHISFSAEPSSPNNDTYFQETPNLDARYGVCDPNSTLWDSNFPCNNKMIGAYDFSYLGGNPDNNATPHDIDGHGTHMASIAAGNNQPDWNIYTGVAPHSQIISYRVCYENGECPGVAVTAAIEQAIADGVDVINYSSTRPVPFDPWDDTVAQGFLSARESNIFVSVPVGNRVQPYFPATIGSPANAPWLLAVGASDDNDEILEYSSRGPNTAVPDVIKPDVIAPGYFIAAAGHTTDYSWTSGSGTSQASAHAAGSAALLKSLNTDWKPAQIQSALMTTAISTGNINDTPFDMGAGRINVEQASRAGFVLGDNENLPEYYNAANPKAGQGGVPSDLNIASLAYDKCFEQHSWTRTLTSTRDDEVAWRVTVVNPQGVELDVTKIGGVTYPAPWDLSLPADGSQTITITATALETATMHEWLFGQVIFTPGEIDEGTFVVNDDIPKAHFPVAVKFVDGFQQFPILSIFSDKGVTDTDKIQGLHAPVNSNIEFHDSNLMPVNDAEIFEGEVDYYNNPWTTDIQVKEGSAALLVQIIETTADDLDLLVYNEDWDVICMEANWNIFRESCVIDNPEPGTYHVQVYKYDGNYGYDSFKLIAVQPRMGASEENFTVSGPATVNTAELFDLDFSWHDLDYEQSDIWWGTFGVGINAQNPDFFGHGNVIVYLQQPWLEEALWLDTNPSDDTITVFARFDREITGPVTFDPDKFRLMLCDESDSIAAVAVNHPANTRFTNLGTDWLVITVTTEYKPGNMESIRSDQVCSLIVMPDGLMHEGMVSGVPAKAPLTPMDLAQGHNYYDSLDLMDIQGRITRDGIPVTGTIKAYLVNIYEESSHYPVGDVTKGTFELSFRNVNNQCITVRYDYSDPEIANVIDQGYGYVNISSGSISSVYEGPLWATFKFESSDNGGLETQYPDNGEPIVKWVEYRSGMVAGECEDEETCCGHVNAVLERDTGISPYTAIGYAGYNDLFYEVCDNTIHQPQTVGKAGIMEDGTYFLHAYRAEWMRNWGADIVVLAVEEDNGEVSIISGLHENDSDYFIRYQPQLNNANGQAYSYIIGDADSFDLAAQAHGIPVNALTTFGLPVNKQFYTNEANPMAYEFQTKVGGGDPEEIQVENMAYFPVWDYNLDGPGIARDYIEDAVGLDHRGFSAVGSMGHMQYLGPGYGYAMMSRCHEDYDAILFFHGKGVAEYKTPLVHNEDNNGWTLVSVAGETGTEWKLADVGNAIAKDGTKPDYVICFDDDFNAYSISFADAAGVTFFGVQAGDLELWLNGVNLGDKKDYPYACFYHVPAAPL